ncbi:MULTISPECIES: hypothetical protein [Algoriphagus]|uniref:Uncharacterized protein n=2 Tax=Algoriphagus TaxID=246875 RepID=A0A841MHS3_9BACT|nr:MULTISPECIES: hypothetical protein [Algoriphagus]MBB6326930.1 hypothetical protein [Algoriphagus iocasae]SMP17018.1 hypothetical protein SAMN06265367_102704 [Algoriphagus winogradskyi]
MQKKSKLAIKHYHGNELEKIGKSATGFPLYVMVRYKNVKTKFASRIGMKFVKDHDGDLSALDREVSRIIEEEVKYIEMLRDYFEDSLEVEFTPSMIVNEAYEKVTLERVVDYFDSIFEDREVKEILWNINQDLAELYEVAGPVRFLSALRHLDSELFSRIMNIPEVKEVFDYYLEYKSLNWPEVTRLQVRMADEEGERVSSKLRKWLDEKFDAEMHHFYHLKPINI